ncbi:MAG: hypothetical protein Q9179_001225 [Wetmoreana sp. 5 TL-2023]
MAHSSMAPSSISAQATATVLLFADTQPLVGSIVATDKATTIYQFQCQPGTYGDECGFPGPFTYVKEGTSSIHWTYNVEKVGYVPLTSPPHPLPPPPSLFVSNSHLCARTLTIGCSLAGTTSAVCTGNQPAGGDIAAVTGGADDEAAAASGGLETHTVGSEIVVTTTLQPDEIQFTQIPITGGVGKAAAAKSTAAAGTASMTGDGASSMKTTGSMATGKTGTATGQAAAGPSGSTGGAVTKFDRTSTVALMGAAALAALMI